MLSCVVQRVHTRFPQKKMESILASLGSLLLKALPTFFLIVVLHFYLKYVFFRPLKRVLDARFEATEGARALAEETLRQVSARAGEYDAAIRAARAEVYQAQEQLHRRLEQERRDEIAAGRARAEEAIRQAKAELAGDVERAHEALARDIEMLAGRIVETVLSRRAA
jgi:F-type H+-transporting ATPase subunit b